jgi:hypothetical protein
MARSILHILLGVLLWGVFGYYWHLVMQRPVSAEMKHALAIVSIIVASITVFDLLWVFHNVRIARRSRRRDRRGASIPPASDFLGRAFVLQDDDMIRRARYVEVHVVEMADAENREAGYKLFRVNDVIPD